MRATQLVALALLAGLVISAIAEEAKLEGKYDGKYDGYKSEGHKSHHKKHHKKDKHDSYDEEYSKNTKNSYDEDYGKKSKDSYDEDYGKNSYDSYGGYGDYDHKPDCGPASFPALRPPSCIDPHSGECVIFSATSCKNTTTSWCAQVNDKWACVYKYKRAGKLCRGVKDGDRCDAPDYCAGNSSVCVDTFKPKTYKCRDSMDDCDVDDYCPGNSATCNNNVADKTKRCRRAHGPCQKDTYCDGVVTFCPRTKFVNDGTPCTEDGLHDEVHDAHGHIMATTAADYDVEKKHKGEEHGWAECHRCHRGHCVPFKYEWWHKEKKSKKHKKHEDEYEYEYESYGGKSESEGDYTDKKEDYEEKKEEKKEKKEKKEDYYYEGDEPSYYDSKVYEDDSYAKLEGYEPKIYCKRHDDDEEE